jgi:geranylgeranyl pyrophosphate synthase/predicted secreted hydrolase
VPWLGVDGLVTSSSAATTRPADWPGAGPIDLVAHDPPHASSTLEWWYVNCHLEAEDGRELSLFASFFRTAVGRDEATGEHAYAHALTWALVDPAGKRYLPEALVDKEAPRIVQERLERGEAIDDPLIRRAMREVVAKGRVPGPDRLLTRPALVADDRLALDYDGRRFERTAEGTYQLTLGHASGEASCRLTFRLTRPPVRHGDEGVVRGKGAEDMFYYFSPRCLVEGTVTIDGEELTVRRGRGWYDHEFGCPPEGRSVESSAGVGWDWISTMLDDGHDLSIYCLYGDEQPIGRFAVLVDPRGGVRRYADDEFRFAAGDGTWTSSKTFQQYPTTWRVEIPEAGIALDATAAFEAQELITSISRPSFWEGRVHVRGTVAGRPARGAGFVERSGIEPVETVDQFFGAVGEATRRSVRRILPLELDRADAAPIVASVERGHYLDGVDLGQLSRALVEPIRTIVDRGGKAWRSYVALACCDAVGGDSQPLIDWLAMPELVHVGSLMVDDVQDGSTVRRGGPASQLVYGGPLSINAGSLCYFLPQIFIERLDAPDTTKVRIYRHYFEAIRAGHAGQALDIDGFGAIADVVRTGDGARAERHVLAVHRMKSAAPASSLARIGAILGRGSEAQVEALGTFVERVGLAFQIVDDVLNLRGFERDTKSLGEDITAGKVTMPIAKTMSLGSPPERARLWEILSAGTTDRALIAEAIGIVEGCGALDACRLDADLLVEQGWAELDPLIPESLAKLMLRVFSWRVLDRTY